MLFCLALNDINPDIKCFTAENGRELFSWLTARSEKPHFIFLDINMPLMNGWECLRKLKDNADYKHIPVVMYSTSSAKADVHKAYELGALLFLTKPEDQEELRTILKIMTTTSHDLLRRSLVGFKSLRLT